MGLKSWFNKIVSKKEEVVERVKRKCCGKFKEDSPTTNTKKKKIRRNRR